MLGHRERLRKRFITAPADLSEVEYIELLLTYAIPRQDVAPLARELSVNFGSMNKILAASNNELLAIKGVGEQFVTLLRLVEFLLKRESLTNSLPNILEKLEPKPELPAKSVTQIFPTKSAPPGKKRQTPNRTFTNDLAQTALDYVPLATKFETAESYEQHLLEVLPYNSDSSRKRYASNLINRYFPEGILQTPLVQFLGDETERASWEAVLFYETVMVEDTLKAVAEKSIWPALPAGKISREQLRSFLNGIFPDISTATMQRMLYSIFNVYSILNGARAEQEILHFQIRKGTLPAFLYVLCAEYPEPGIYDMGALEAGPMRRWLLWDRDWMRRQLYNLQDLGILAKVSEIDTIRQFTLAYSRFDALNHYYYHPQRTTIALREKPL